MKALVLQEWGYLPIGSGSDQVTREEADRLLAVAERAGRDLSLQSTEGERVLQDGRHRLRAQQTVGILSAPGIRLELLPKIEGLAQVQTRRRLVHMIAACENLDLSAEEQAQIDSQDRDLLEILISLFARRLVSALRAGVARGYVAKQEDRSSLKGQLAVERQFVHLAGRADRLACRFDEFSADVDLNRILATAADALLRMTRSSVTRQALAHGLAQFDGVPLLPPSVLPPVHFSRLTARFAPAHALARLFLQGRHQTTSSGADTGQAILFRMNVLFEVYVTQAVRRAVVPLGWRVTAQGPQRPALWRGSSGVFQMKPDVALHRDGLTLIMDAKWKKLTPHARDPRRGIAQADIYQIMAYSQSYAAAAVALVYPHCQGNEPLDRLRIGAGAQDLVVAALPVADAQGMAKAIPELMAWMNQSATK